MQKERERERKVMEILLKLEIHFKINNKISAI